MLSYTKLSSQKETPVLGIQAVTSTALEFSGNGKIPGLWEAFYQHGLDAYAHQNSLAIYGIYSQYENDETGAYTVTAGVGPCPDSLPEKSLQKASLEPGTYLKFSFEGPVPDSVIQGWQDVWAFFKTPEAPQRAFKTDYEVYKETGVDIFIGILN